MVTILLVEDERIIRRNLVKAIDWLALGCEIIAECRTGEEGLEAIESTAPQIVITDINLPYISGIEMLDRAKKKRIYV
jgi:two-component system response regulator YesN